MNNEVFGRTVENKRKHRDIQLVTTISRRNYLVSESNYHTANFFSENLSAMEIKKNTHKKKYVENAKIIYMDIDLRYLVGQPNISQKEEDIYSDIVKDIETRFNTSNYELDHYVKGKCLD